MKSGNKNAIFCNTMLLVGTILALNMFGMPMVGQPAVLAGDSNSSQGWTSIFNGKGLPLPGWRFLDLKKL